MDGAYELVYTGTVTTSHVLHVPSNVCDMPMHDMVHLARLPTWQLGMGQQVNGIIVLSRILKVIGCWNCRTKVSQAADIISHTTAVL
ncbi:hypothetical protein ABBQ38_005091 [Trebouxia sp. C0009 RCD-2024]